MFELNNCKDITLIGQDLVPFRRPIIKPLDVSAIGISSGMALDNHDVVASLEQGKQFILSIAEGEWGNKFRKLAIKEMINSFEEFSNEPTSWVYRLNNRINLAMLMMSIQEEIEDKPRNAFIVTHILQDTFEGKSRVHWVSYGNVFLYLCDTASKARRLNNVQPMWLSTWEGRKEQPLDDQDLASTSPKSYERGWLDVPVGLEVGLLELNAGDTLILSSDGLPQCQQSNCTTIYPSDIQNIISRQISIDNKCRALIDTALMLGGIDNISCAVYQSFSQ